MCINKLHYNINKQKKISFAAFDPWCAILFKLKCNKITTKRTSAAK